MITVEIHGIVYSTRYVTAFSRSELWQWVPQAFVKQHVSQGMAQYRCCLKRASQAPKKVAKDGWCASQQHRASADIAGAAMINYY